MAQTIKMKTRNFRIIKNLIKKHAARFDMSQWGKCDLGNECGTVGCIAGFCKAYVNLKKFKAYEGIYTNEAAEKFLGLTPNQAAQLFLASEVWVKYSKELSLTANGRNVMMSDVTPDKAVTMLENLASGKWSF